MISGREVIIVRKHAFVTVLAVSFGLMVCSSCSRPDQTVRNAPKPGAAVKNLQVRNQGATLWWKNPEIADEIHLTEEQSEKIEAIMGEVRSEAVELAERERRAATRFHRVLSRGDLNPEHVDRMSAELDEVLSARHRVRINRVRRMREVLTQEQWEKLWQLAPNSLQVGQVRIIRGPNVYVTDGTPAPDLTATLPLGAQR